MKFTVSCFLIYPGNNIYSLGKIPYMHHMFITCVGIYTQLYEKTESYDKNRYFGWAIKTVILI